MRNCLVILFLLLAILAGIMRQTTWVRPLPHGYSRFYTDLRRDIQLRAGMTVSEINAYIKKNEELVDQQEAKYGNDGPPIYTARELHLYVFIDMNGDEPSEQSLTYLVNGRYQFWMDIALDHGKIKNIYVTPGNMSNFLYPSVLYDGSGEHVGMLALRKK